MPYDNKYWKNDTLEYVNKLDDFHKQLMIDAIKDLLKENLEWEWINIAIKRKSINTWNNQASMGLLFNNKYRRSVYAQLEHNRKVLEKEPLNIFEEFSDYENYSNSNDFPF